MKICTTRIITKMENKILPFFENRIALVFSCDTNYAPYLGVALQSLLAHTTEKLTYDIVVLETALTDEIKRRLRDSIKRENISIRFFNMKALLAGKSFYVLNYFSTATYYRIFVGEIFPLYEKVIYMDCDALLLDDIASLYSVDLGNNILAAVRDTEVIKRLWSGNRRELTYFTEYLGLRNSWDYFQCGLLIFNIKEVIKNGFRDMFLTAQRKITAPRFVDQDIINVVAGGKVMMLPQRWNVENHLIVYNADISSVLPQDAYAEYKEGLENAAFLHYSSSKKPWRFPYIQNADKWWTYARSSPFYEEILSKYLREVMSSDGEKTRTDLSLKEASAVSTLEKINSSDRIFKEMYLSLLPLYRRKFKRIRWKALFSWGRRKQRYLKRKEQLKEKINAVEKFSKNK